MGLEFCLPQSPFFAYFFPLPSKSTLKRLCEANVRLLCTLCFTESLFWCYYPFIISESENTLNRKSSLYLQSILILLIIMLLYLFLKYTYLLCWSQTVKSIKDFRLSLVSRTGRFQWLALTRGVQTAKTQTTCFFFFLIAYLKMYALNLRYFLFAL